jgi:hypothetical protein
MPIKKKSKGSQRRRAVEVIIAVPHGANRVKADRLIQDALRQQVPTDVLEHDELVVVQVVHDGNGNGLIPKKLANKKKA